MGSAFTWTVHNSSNRKRHQQHKEFKPREGALLTRKSSWGTSLLHNFFSGESLHKLNKKPMKFMENEFT